ncbi:MAG: VOC family protein [Anaerolineae bacterium]|nr:VOC family protein [Anaerolineae bacterium]NIQ80309.1 VOC family protein [Anaerolineae bacterium]
MDREAGLFSARLSQIGIVVRDAERAGAMLSALLGIGPFVFMTPGFREANYQGRRASFRAKLGFADAGPVQIELVQPLEGSSTWQEFLSVHGEGIHHIGFDVSDLTAALETAREEGIGVIQSGRTEGGSHWAYLDTVEKVGVIVELMQRPTTNT